MENWKSREEAKQGGETVLQVQVVKATKNRIEFLLIVIDVYHLGVILNPKC